MPGASSGDLHTIDHPIESLSDGPAVDLGLLTIEFKCSIFTPESVSEKFLICPVYSGNQIIQTFYATYLSQARGGGWCTLVDQPP